MTLTEFFTELRAIRHVRFQDHAGAIRAGTMCPIEVVANARVGSSRGWRLDAEYLGLDNAARVAIVTAADSPMGRQRLRLEMACGLMPEPMIAAEELVTV